MADHLTSLDDLLRAIHNAGIEAQKLTEQQHIRQLRRYFKDDGEPITLPIQIPNPHFNPLAADPSVPPLAKTVANQPPLEASADLTRPSERYVKFDAPLLSLVPPAALRIKALDVRFKVRLQGLLADAGRTSTDPVTGEEHKTKGALNIEMGGGMFGRKSQMADITITFEGTDAPESLMKINDHFLRSFP